MKEIPIFSHEILDLKIKIRSKSGLNAINNANDDDNEEEDILGGIGGDLFVQLPEISDEKDELDLY